MARLGVSGLLCMALASINPAQAAQLRGLAGDSFAMEFWPGKGATFFVVGQAQGAPVGDAEFFNMVLKIWVGSSPADWALKDALLAQ